jgi:Mce-associated membrane protein
MPASRRSWIVPGVLAVLVLALLATSFVLRPSGREADPGMLVAARQQAKNFFSLDYRHADADVDRVLALATGKFKKEYSSRRQEVIAGVTGKKLVVTASIPRDGAAVELVDGDRGQVLVAVDVSTGTLTGPTTENRYRARILLTRVDGRWLVSDVNQVG